MTLCACFLLGSVLAYGLVMVVYRLRIHPLSKFPGPRLAALTGLYEIYFAAWGSSSFEDEIERMHREYGPVVRITPDEIHVQEQFYNPSHADCWIKGTRALSNGRHQRGHTAPSFQIRKRSISRVRSILQVEVHQIIRGLVQKHHVHKVFSSRIRPLMPGPGVVEIPVEHSEESEGDIGYEKATLPITEERNDSAMYSAVQKISGRSLPF